MIRENNQTLEVKITYPSQSDIANMYIIKISVRHMPKTGLIKAKKTHQYEFQVGCFISNLYCFTFTQT